MNNFSIEAFSLSKLYRINGARRKRETFLGACLDVIKKPIHNYHKMRKMTSFSPLEDENDILWALQDVSFAVRHGESIGIIGRNGSGKSTLLKVLSKITKPTKGYALLDGRIASLLEVGTGFHRDLSGRENIYLNGAILGMLRAEIRSKFDEIVDFSGVERFIDTPVKHYSSGMKVRLAFAVAAHLDPEILLIDEVLAVGDVAFQKKCLKKMEDVTEEGRTVILVSHNMSAIMQLCQKAILLEHGRLVAEGPAKELVERYLASLIDQNRQPPVGQQAASKTSRFRFSSVSLEDAQGRRTQFPISGQNLRVVMAVDAQQPLTHVQVMFTIFNQKGVALSHCNVDVSGQRMQIPPGSSKITCEIQRLPLITDQYRIAVAAYDVHGLLHLVPNACTFSIEVSEFYKTTYLPPRNYSPILLEQNWQLNGKNTYESCGA